MASRTLYTTGLLFCVALALGVVLPGDADVEALSAVSHFSAENLARALVPGETSDVSLSTVSRVFVPAQLQGAVLKHSGADTMGVQCPAGNVKHEYITPIPLRGDVFWVPHSNILHDGERCGTGNPSEYMLIVNGKDIINEETAADNGLHYVWAELRKNNLGFIAFEALQSIDPVHIGLEINMDRKCGGKTIYPSGSVFVFTSPSKTHIDLSFAFFPQFSVGMLSVLNNQRLCGFSNGKFSPAQTPLTFDEGADDTDDTDTEKPAEANATDMPSPTSDE